MSTDVDALILANSPDNNDLIESSNDINSTSGAAALSNDQSSASNNKRLIITNTKADRERRAHGKRDNASPNDQADDAATRKR
jgi:hypothetical protein